MGKLIVLIVSIIVFIVGVVLVVCGVGIGILLLVAAILAILASAVFLMASRGILPARFFTVRYDSRRGSLEKLQLEKEPDANIWDTMAEKKSDSKP